MRDCVTIPSARARSGRKYALFAIGASALFFHAVTVRAAVPAIDSFTASPAQPTPALVVTLTLNAHDPDCASACTSGCGQYIRPDLLAWSDNTGRSPATVFLNPLPGPAGSPWSGTIDWVAPVTEGSYVITAAVSDSGGSLCGGRGTTYATLTITVSSTPPPVVDSFTVSPTTVPVGGKALLSAAAHAPGGGPLTYTFSADAGTILQNDPSLPTAEWTAPQSAGTVNLRCQVIGASGPPVTAQTTAQVALGSFIGWLPLIDGRATRVGALPDGRLAIMDAVAGTLSAVSTLGEVSWTVRGLSQPLAAAASATEIYVLERGVPRIAVFGTGGSALRTIPCPGQAPSGLAAGPGAGELTVTDTSGAALNVISSATGQLLRTLGQGTLSFPSGLASSRGRLAVADPGIRRVLLLDGAGSLLATLGDDTMFVRPQGVTWDPAGDRLIVSDSFSAELTVLGTDGSVLGQLAGFGTGAGQITAPVDVQLAGGGILAVPVATTGQVALYQLLSSLPPVKPPTGVNAGSPGLSDGGMIPISWTRSADDPGRVVGYRVERYAGPGTDFMIRGTAPAGATSFLDRGVTDGQCYIYRVAATDGVTEGLSDEAPCGFSVNNLPPPAPAFASAVPQSPTTALLTWAPVNAPDLSAYSVQIVGTKGTSTLSFPAVRTQALLSSLLPDHAYRVSVLAVDTAGNVSPPAQAGFSTYPDEAPPSPAGVAVTDRRTGGELSVTWAEEAVHVPVARFHVTLKPQAPGWPTVEADATKPPVTIGGLVNRLVYSASVTALTPWGRESAPSAGAPAAPTAPPRDLAVVPEVGWPGNRPDPDAGGIVLRIPVRGHERELRLEYRANRSHVQILLDGAPLGRPLADTIGEWAEARIPLSDEARNGNPVRLLELRNAGFPDPSAIASFRRIDLVPLPLEEVGTESFNTVVDLKWKPAETRADLLVKVSRAAGRSAPGATADIACTAPSLDRCRATFQPNGKRASFEIRVVSPAGWESGRTSAAGEPSFEESPPPVTDLLVTPADPAAGGGWTLNWTPLSTATREKGAPSPVHSYRIYRQEGRTLVLLREVSAPPAQLPSEALDAAGSSAVVRSVDVNERESK